MSLPSTEDRRKVAASRPGRSMGSRTWTASGVDADESDAAWAAVKLEADGVVSDSSKRIWRISLSWIRKSSGSVYLMEGPYSAALSLHVEHHRH
jgi:hypothetical protein